MKLKFSLQFFEKYSNTKFPENLSSGRQVVPLRTDGRTDRQTGMMKLIVAYGNVANAPN
jgi:hypothetical protein